LVKKKEIVICTSPYNQMSAAKLDNTTPSIPVLLLKTRSSPSDAYEELFSAPGTGDFVFEPRFLPVLEHRFKTEGLARVRELLQARQIGANEGCLYGGLVFTSQRAVEAFAEVVDKGKGPSEHRRRHLRG
jgi:uroporphyrinogen-III synthase